MARRNPEPAVVRNAFKVGKARKKILQPRAHNVGYLKATRKRPAQNSPLTEKHREAVDRSVEILASEDKRVMKVADPKALYVEHLHEARAMEVAQTGGVVVDMGNPVRRQRYAALETAKELAAVKLGAGGTLEEAGDEAGVSASTVKKWLADEDFLARVNELRSVRRMTVGARIEAWMERRTADAERLDEADPKVTLAIYDRIAPLGRGGVHAEQTNVTVNNYPELMGRLAHITAERAASGDVADAGAESGAFPTVGVERAAVAGDVPPGPDAVHSPRSGETSG